MEDEYVMIDDQHAEKILYEEGEFFVDKDSADPILFC